jgi:hypothetical protein
MKTVEERLEALERFVGMDSETQNAKLEVGAPIPHSAPPIYTWLSSWAHRIAICAWNYAIANKDPKYRGVQGTLMREAFDIEKTVEGSLFWKTVDYAFESKRHDLLPGTHYCAHAPAWSPKRREIASIVVDLREALTKAENLLKECDKA